MRVPFLAVALMILPLTAADLRVDVPIVQVNLSVTDMAGAPVLGLERSQFRLFEDGVEQSISSFGMDDAPVSVALLFDASGSMDKKLAAAQRAMVELLKTSNPDDEYALVLFNNRARFVLSFANDADEIRSRLFHVRPAGRTALLDAIHLALTHMKDARYARKALVIISDGGDNQSRYTEPAIRNELRETDVQLYAIGIFGPAENRMSPEEANGPELLKSLAQDAGGRYFQVEDLGILPEIGERVGRLLRNQYWLMYTPANQQRDGKFRHVTVTLAHDGLPLRLGYRRGYYAPLD